MKNEIYTPMEQVLINAAKLLTTKEVCEESIETNASEDGSVVRYDGRCEIGGMAIMTDRQKGELGEKNCIQLLTSWGYEVENVSKNPEYYYKGDLIATSPTTGNKRMVEVKWCYNINRTNNLYLEVWSAGSKKKNCEGWFKWCEADYLAYGDAHTGQFYLFDMNALHKRAAEVPYKERSCGYESRGQIVSLDQVRDLILNQ